MAVRVETKLDVAILKLRGNFFGDRETDKLRHVIRQLVADGNLKLVIDLGDVYRMDSLALGVLVGAHKNYVSRGGRIILADLDKHIEDLLIITRLARIFEIGPTLPEALTKLGL